MTGISLGTFGRVDYENPLAPGHRIRFAGIVTRLALETDDRGRVVIAVRRWRGGSFATFDRLVPVDAFTPRKAPKSVAFALAEKPRLRNDCRGVDHVVGKVRKVRRSSRLV